MLTNGTHVGEHPLTVQNLAHSRQAVGDLVAAGTEPDGDRAGLRCCNAVELAISRHRLGRDDCISEYASGGNLNGRLKFDSRR